jgi:type VII secretion protein EccB
VPSRQDQLHSYQYSLQRVVAALVTHDPDPHRSPLRRAGTTALVSLVIAALAVTGAAVYGLLQGTSGKDPRDDTVVFLEKGSGARYVYLTSDKKLHPVLNYTSGLLVANATEPKVVNTSRDQLAKVPLGDPLGIPDAPDSLPTTDDLVPGRWTICSQQSSGTSSSLGPQSLLLVGDAVTDGALLPVQGTETTPSELRALLVTDPTGRTFLVYSNHRFAIPANRVQQTRTRFGWTDQPLPVATAWINAVPAGPDLKPPAIPDLGDSSPVVSDYEIGQILRIPGEGGRPDQWGVVMADGVANITPAQALLMQTDPEGYDPKDMGADLYGNLPQSKTQLVTAANTVGFPQAAPTLLNRPQRGVCLTYDTGVKQGKDPLSIRIDPTVPAGAPVPGETSIPGRVQADLVHVPRGKGALVVAAASPSAPATGGTVSIVTDTGLRYPVATREVLAKLGYGGVSPRQIPAQLIGLLPQGPSLDAVKAREASSGTGD